MIGDVELWAKQNNFTIVEDKWWEAAQDIICKYQQLQSDYETRLKADMVAMLTDIQLEIEEQCKIPNNCASAYDWNNGVYACYKAVQQKIDAVKGKEDGKIN